jgi:hypothetical protein
MSRPRGSLPGSAAARPGTIELTGNSMHREVVHPVGDDLYNQTKNYAIENLEAAANRQMRDK